MNVSKIKISNILGLENLEIEPGNITEITGANGTGKTSVLEAVKAALGGGHDASLVRVGAEKGEIVLILDDGVEIKRTVTPEKSNTTVKHPTFGKISKPGEYLKNLADALSVNPVEFLTAKPKDRVDTLLSAIPMRVEASQISFVPADALKSVQVNLDNHAMIVLEALRRVMYDARTGVNRSLKDKQATARQLSETIPAAPPAGGWKSQLTAAESEYESMRNEASEALTEMKTTAENANTEANAILSSIKEETSERVNKEIDRIKEAAEKEIAQATKEFNNAIAAAQERKEQRHAELEAKYRPKEAELKERIGHARAMVEQETKAAETRKLAAQMESDAQQLLEESDRLTNGLARLEELKTSLLSSLPIPGLEIKDGEIYVDGVPFDRVNESVRVRLAIEVAKLRVGKLGLIAVDGLECMDSKTFAAFEKSAADSGLQFVVSRVSDGPLYVENREVA